LEDLARPGSLSGNPARPRSNKLSAKQSPPRNGAKANQKGSRKCDAFPGVGKSEAGYSTLQAQKYSHNRGAALVQLVHVEPFGSRFTNPLVPRFKWPTL